MLGRQAQRLTRYRDLHETGDIALDMLDDETRADSLAAAERTKATFPRASARGRAG